MEWLKDVGSSIVDSINPINWFKEGQARDEARTERLEDRADQKEYQRENSLPNRVKQARDAGISPLAALGLNPAGHMASATSAANLSGSGGGQNVLSPVERESIRLNQELLRVQIEGEKIENLRKSQSLREPKTGQPVSGITNKDGQVVMKPAEVIASSMPGVQAGASPEVQFIKNYAGGLGPMKSDKFKELSDDEIMATLEWYGRNRLGPAIHGLPPPSPKDYPTKEGHFWDWNAFKQMFESKHWRQIQKHGPPDTWMFSPFTKLLWNWYKKDSTGNSNMDLALKRRYKGPLERYHEERRKR